MEIASAGHMPTHASHPMHFSSSSFHSVPSTVIASAAHSFTHAAQYTHLSSSTAAMLFFAGAAGAAGAAAAPPNDRLFLGHLSMQAPHLIHALVSNYHDFAFLSTLIASEGHALTQIPQNKQVYAQVRSPSASAAPLDAFDAFAAFAAFVGISYVSTTFTTSGIVY